MTNNTVTPSSMTSAERTDLRSLIRQRAKLMKAHVAQRGLELMADFERQLQTYFSFDQDEVWEAAYAEAEKAAQDASAQIALRCRELGIPKKLAPTLSFGWRGQGGNASKHQHADMRREGWASGTRATTTRRSRPAGGSSVTCSAAASSVRSWPKAARARRPYAWPRPSRWQPTDRSRANTSFSAAAC